MSAPARLAAFALAVAVAFALGLGVGGLAGPLDEDEAPAPVQHGFGGHG